MAKRTTTTPKAAPKKAPVESVGAASTDPVQEPKKYLGRFGVNHLVVRLQDKEVNGRMFKEILTHDGQTFLLSEQDLAKQMKPLE